MDTPIAIVEWVNKDEGKGYNGGSNDRINLQCKQSRRESRPPDH